MNNWEMVEPVLRERQRVESRGRLWDNTRAALNRVFRVLGTGAVRELPEEYPPFQARHRRFHPCVSWSSE